MLTNKLKSALIATASAGAMFLGLASPASAGAINFTWNPAGSTPALSNVGSLISSASNITVQDFATLYIPSTCFFGAGCGANSIVENGFIVFSAMDVLTPGLTTAAGGSQAGANPYVLYLSFGGTAQAGPGGGGNLITGFFDSLNYSLIGYGDTTMGGTQFCMGDGTTCGGGNSSIPTARNVAGGTTDTGPITLGSGVLQPGGVNDESIDSSGVPHAAVQATFVPVAAQVPGFFVSPTSYLNVDLFSAFTNVNAFTLVQTAGFNCNGKVLAAGDSCYEIHNGGGNANFAATPEPSTLLLFGSGLLGLGFFFSRRRTDMA